MERLQKSNYEQMQICGSSPKPTLEVPGIKTQNTTEEGWTPELLGMALLAIDIALLDEKNWEVYKRLHE